MRPNPRKRTAAGAALLSTAALLALGVQTVPAAAKPASPHPPPLPTGGLSADLTPAPRTTRSKSPPARHPTPAPPPAPPPPGPPPARPRTSENRVRPPAT